MSDPRRRLTRSSRERLWAGVAGGMAEYFDVDPAIMRIIWVAAAVLSSGLAVPAYIVLWLILPRDDGQPEPWARAVRWPRTAAAPGAPPFDPPPDPAAAPPPGPAGEPAPGPAAGDPAAGGDPFARPGAYTAEEAELLRPVAPPAPSEDETGRRRRAAGILLIGLGLIFFAEQLGIFVHVRWDLIWPLALVGAGVFLLTRNTGGWRR